MKRQLAHPSWCSEGYRCSADRPLGEHRSDTITFAREGERFHAVVSITQRVDRQHPRAEIRLSVRLLSRSSVGQAREVWRLLRQLGQLIREEIPR